MLVGINTLQAADGSVVVWIDGKRILEYSDVELQTPTYEGDFAYFVLFPGWLGDAARDDSDRILFDHVRITGAR